MKKLSESSQQESLRRVKASDITLTEDSIRELNALRNRPVDLSDQDVPEATQWEGAVVGKFYRPIKKQITLRLDADVLDWFKNAADKYQTLINEACRDYMNQHK